MELREPLFEDDAISGKAMLVGRPAGRRLDQRLKKGDHVVFSKFDRACRDTVDFLQTTASWTARGVVTHIDEWRLDTTQPFWTLMAPIMATVAHVERLSIIQRVKESVGELKRQGRRYALDAPHGFKWVADPAGGRSKRGNPRKILAPDPAELEQMRQIWLMRESGMSREVVWKKLLLARVANPRTGKEYGETSIKNIHKQYKRYLEMVEGKDEA